jgi:enoyl-[acyl-carrier-protein] reductase (NADH)
MPSAPLCARGDAVAMLTRAYPCDVTEEAHLDATLEAIRAELGALRVLIHLMSERLEPL